MKVGMWGCDMIVFYVFLVFGELVCGIVEWVYCYWLFFDCCGDGEYVLIDIWDIVWNFFGWRDNVRNVVVNFFDRFFNI